MGRDKARLPFPSRPLLLVVVERLARVCERVVVSSAAPATYSPLGVVEVADEPAGRGPLGGLATCMERIPAAAYAVVACDMPFLCAPLLRWQIERAGRAEAVVLQSARGEEPLHAVYCAEALAALQEYLAAGGRRMEGFLAGLRREVIPRRVVRRFDPSERCFVNVNTEEEYQRAVRELSLG